MVWSEISYDLRARRLCSNFCSAVMMAALGPPRFALQPLGCHHGPWAGRKTHDPSGGGSVRYHYATPERGTMGFTYPEGCPRGW
jgi:hypothetical protein